MNFYVGYQNPLIPLKIIAKVTGWMDRFKTMARVIPNNFLSEAQQHIVKNPGSQIINKQKLLDFT